ncbi:MAG TPA: hypothetical protein PLM98_00040 [Thiolinea sp.]|nr:hypothetical protein [Thiolinea sp.]
MRQLLTSAALVSCLTACAATLPTPSSPSDGEPQYVFTATVQAANRIEVGRGGATGSMPTYRLTTTIQYVARGDAYIQPAQSVAVELIPGQALPGQFQTCQFVAKERHPAYASGVLLLNARIVDCR